MGFFDDVKDTVVNTGRGVGNKAKELAEVTKLKNAIAAQERKIREQYETIGKLYVENYGQQPEAMFQDAITAIHSAKAVIVQKQEELNELRSVKICPACGAALEEESAFCNKCGAKV